MDELNSSEIGTKEYWNNVYQNELLNFKDHNDPGFEWFGKMTRKRVVKWINSCKKFSKNASIIDLGCGNGLMLLELAKCGFNNLTGIDYCNDALNLAKNIFTSEGHEAAVTSWLSLDITSETIISHVETNLKKSWSKSNAIPSDFVQQTFDICFDKGTYDAISLSPESRLEKRLLYIENVKRLLSSSGTFIIVSCNWTCSELKEHFQEFKFIEELPAPSFSFGGQTGQTVSTCVFEHR